VNRSNITNKIVFFFFVNQSVSIFSGPNPFYHAYQLTSFLKNILRIL